MFITFEGIDGSGKSTQIHLVDRWLQEKGFHTVLTRDPGGTCVGQKIRQILLDRNSTLYPECEMFLYLADRSQHVNEIIKPALKAGKVVLCDRYIDSTLAYQGYGREINLEKIGKLNDMATSYLKPDVTLIFDLDVHQAIARVNKNGVPDRLENENVIFWKKVKEGYLSIAKMEPERCFLVDADQEAESVFQIIKNHLENYIY